MDRIDRDFGIDYPIRYALLPMVEQRGFVAGIDGIQPKYIRCGYIVSKCFVIEENTRHYGNGESTNSYNVVFPYKSFDSIYKKMTTPIISFGKCINADTVSFIFDGYSEAKAMCQEQNNMITLEMINSDAYSDFERKLLLDAEVDKLEKFQEFEDQIEDATSELLLGNRKGPSKHYK